MSWLTKGTRNYKTSLEKHNDDKKWLRGHKEFIYMHECNETRCYGWQDNRKMQDMWKNNACKRVPTNRDAIEQKPISMDWEAIENNSRYINGLNYVNSCQEKKKEAR